MWIGAGGSNGGNYPAQYFMEHEARSVASHMVTSNEFVFATPAYVGPTTLAVAVSMRGTPETIEAARVAKERGAATIAVYVDESGLTEACDYQVRYMSLAVDESNMGRTNSAVVTMIAMELLDQTNADVLVQDICKVNFRVADAGLHRELEAFVAEHAGAFANASFDGVLFELTDAHVNKGEAVAWLAAELGIAEDEVAVYGDGGNDLAMLERFAHAYATSNGSEAAKRAAGTVIGSCALHAVPRHMLRTVRREGPLA